MEAGGKNVVTRVTISLALLQKTKQTKNASTDVLCKYVDALCT